MLFPIISSHNIDLSLELCLHHFMRVLKNVDGCFASRLPLYTTFVL